VISLRLSISVRGVYKYHGDVVEPQNAEKLANALSLMLNRPNERPQNTNQKYIDDDINKRRKPLDLKYVSLLFDVPYNTLRDHYLRCENMIT